MSKRELKKYLTQLPKDALEEQIVALYDKFIPVKAYYDFVFNPKEEKLVNEAKIKISNEYFPVKTKRAKLRRSVAQKHIKHFLLLGVDPFGVADVMLHAIEVAQKYSARREMKYASFYKSMQTAFEQAANYVIVNGIAPEFRERIVNIVNEANRQKWENRYELTRVMELFED